MTLIISNSFQKLWLGSTDFTNVTSKDFFLSVRLKSQFLAFKICSKWIFSMKNEFSTLLQPKKLILIAKRCPFKAQWLSHKSVHWLTFLLLLKLKKAKDHWFRTPKFYICIILLVACWKFQKICRKKHLWGVYDRGVRFFWTTLYSKFLLQNVQMIWFEY